MFGGSYQPFLLLVPGIFPFGYNKIGDYLLLVSFLQVARLTSGKKGGATGEGIVRCTFEDRILMSDIVFMKVFAQVDVPRFYNPLTTSLQPRDKTWQGMKTVAELRRENNLPIPVNKDSLYKVFFSYFVTSISCNYFATD